LALAREFARNGYDLLLVARKEEALKEAATEIEHFGATIIGSGQGVR
jgi:short-subunit dehydrogenase